MTVTDKRSCVGNRTIGGRTVTGSQGGNAMKSAKRSIMLDGRKTSVSLEDAFWAELQEIARSQRVTVSSLLDEIEATRKQSNLSSAIRIFVLESLQKRHKSARPPQSARATVNET
jgi:predicted DNA-binding ribbon-helix-helix protein